MRWAWLILAIGLIQISAREAREIPIVLGQGAKAGFHKLSPAETGIYFTNLLPESIAATNRNLLNGSGVAAGDVNGDGWCDLFFCAIQGQSRLFLNRGEWKFSDATAESGLVLPEERCTGAAFADLDGDGDLDLLVTGLGNGTRLFLNDGRGRFSDFTTQSGLDARAASMSMALADIDGDGDLDLYVTNLRKETVRDAPQTKFSVEYVGNKPVVARVNGRPADSPDLTNRFGLSETGEVLEYGEADALYENDGSGKFTRVPFASGRFLDHAGKPLAAPPLDWGLAAQFHDLNGDMLPDLYVCNDYFTPDRFWFNRGAGIFQEAAPRALRHTSFSSMGVDCADVDRDGHPDIFVVDMLSRSRVQKQVQVGDFAPVHAKPGEMWDTPQYPQNSLYLNRGGGEFSEIGFFAGLEASEWSWCPIFLDVDLDGWEDLVISTGHARDLRDADAHGRIRDMLASGQVTFAQPERLIGVYPELRSSIVGFRNKGDLTFEDASAAWGLEGSDISQGMALADLDNDGDMDLVANNFRAAPAIYRNESTAPRVAVRLKGARKNTSGIGCKIYVRANGIEMRQEMISAGRYLSCDQAQRTFAAPGETVEIEARWPSGKISIVSGASANRIYEIEEP